MCAAWLTLQLCLTCAALPYTDTLPELISCLEMELIQSTGALAERLWSSFSGQLLADHPAVAMPANRTWQNCHTLKSWHNLVSVGTAGDQAGRAPILGLSAEHGQV